VPVAYQLAPCVVCGHSEADVVADDESMRREVQALWAYHEKRLKPGTPPERLMDRVAFSEHPPFRLVQCRECGLVYRNPIERTLELEQIYARESPDPAVLSALHETQRRAYHDQARELRRILGRRGSGLEVGSYFGGFLAAARDQGLQFEGVDVNASANAFTRSHGFVVHDGTLASVATDRVFDAVAIWNTFDQLADPRGTVNEAWKRLRPGGILAIRVPNGDYYAARRHTVFDGDARARAAALGALAQNNLLTFPYRYGFTPRSLPRLVIDCGFDVRQVRGDVLVPIGDEWTRAWGRLEERLIKGVMRLAARRNVHRAPWFELYASRE
jgi:SAM-dependent methyltransferase